MKTRLKNSPMTRHIWSPICPQCCFWLNARQAKVQGLMKVLQSSLPTSAGTLRVRVKIFPPFLAVVVTWQSLLPLPLLLHTYFFCFWNPLQEATSQHCASGMVEGANRRLSLLSEPCFSFLVPDSPQAMGEMCLLLESGEEPSGVPSTTGFCSLYLPALSETKYSQIRPSNIWRYFLLSKA